MCVCACDRCPGAILDDHNVKTAIRFYSSSHLYDIWALAKVGGW